MTQIKHTHHFEQDTKERQKAKKATDLGLYAQSVWNSRGLKAKKDAAEIMSQHMTAGNIPEFRKSVEQAPTEKEVDKIVANTMLSGEGHSTQRINGRRARY